MPRVKTAQGVQEFSYTPGGMAAARQAAADQMSLGKPPDYGGMAAGGLQGAISGAATGAKLSGGNPLAVGAGAILGGAAGVAGASEKQMADVGSAGQRLAKAYQDEKAPAGIAKLGSKLQTFADPEDPTGSELWRLAKIHGEV